MDGGGYAAWRKGTFGVLVFGRLRGPLGPALRKSRRSSNPKVQASWSLVFTRLISLNCDCSRNGAPRTAPHKKARPRGRGRGETPQRDGKNKKSRQAEVINSPTPFLTPNLSGGERPAPTQTARSASIDPRAHCTRRFQWRTSSNSTQSSPRRIPHRPPSRSRSRSRTLGAL